MVVLFWLDLWEIFFLATLGFEPRTSGSLVLHSTTVPQWTFGFHLWQFEVFNSGADGLVVVLFWLDLWDIFILATLGFEPGTSGSLVLHSTTVPQSTSSFHLWQFQVFYSGRRGIGGGIVLIGPVRHFHFSHTGVWTQDLWISSPALYQCAMATSGFHPWQFQVFNSGAEGLVVVLFWLDLWEIFFLATPGFEPGTSGSLVLHSTTVTSGFHLWQFEVFNSGADGLVVVLFWLDLWEILFLATLGFQPRTSGSLVLHSTTVPWQLLVFTFDIFRYLTLVQRDLWWYCSDWTCERFSFYPHWGFNPGTLDL